MRIYNVITADDIKDARWLFSLPVKSRTKWTGPIYKAVMELKAADKCGGKDARALSLISQIFAQAALENDPRVLDTLINAHALLEVSAKASPTGGGEAISSVIKRRRQPELGIKNQAKCQKTIDFIDEVEIYQNKNFRIPKKSELEKILATSRREIDRQIERLEWEHYF